MSDSCSFSLINSLVSMEEYILPCSIYFAVALVSQVFFMKMRFKSHSVRVDVIWMLDFHSHLYTKRQPWFV